MWNKWPMDRKWELSQWPSFPQSLTHMLDAVGKKSESCLWSLFGDIIGFTGLPQCTSGLVSTLSSSVAVTTPLPPVVLHWTSVNRNRESLRRKHVAYGKCGLHFRKKKWLTLFNNEWNMSDIWSWGESPAEETEVLSAGIMIQYHFSIKWMTARAAEREEQGV